ncbi:MAG: hypothetical protein IT452_21900 [Planctomycetia bacterium]|nr:hypothetical protein [Planctomycetia bacterium]
MTAAVKRLEQAERRRASLQTLAYLLVAGMAMLFASLTAAYLVRRHGADWERVRLSPAVWVNAGVLAAAGAALEWGKRRGAGSRRRWIGASLGLAVVFLAGQAGAWRELAAAGVSPQTHPHAAFFAVFAAVHAAHVAAGAVALACALPHPRPLALGLCAVWWHAAAAAWAWSAVLLSWF